jgi:hypothetical protein
VQRLQKLADFHQVLTVQPLRGFLEIDLLALALRTADTDTMPSPWAMAGLYRAFVPGR